MSRRIKHPDHEAERQARIEALSRVYSERKPNGRIKAEPAVPRFGTAAWHEWKRGRMAERTGEMASSSNQTAVTLTVQARPGESRERAIYAALFVATKAGCDVMLQWANTYIECRCNDTYGDVLARNHHLGTKRVTLGDPSARDHQGEGGPIR